MAEEESNISGMIPNTINILRDNLRDRYDSGFPILKELIQNANDAKASVLKISKSDGIKNSEHPLLQKTALVVFNNGIVTDTDLEGIKSVAQGGKTGQTGVIGKFGLGMKSIFHFCDMFFYVAVQSNKYKIRAVNPYIDLVKRKDPFHIDWNIFSAIDESLLKKEAQEIIGDFEDGLLLWIPLRDNSYKHMILKDVYRIDDIWKQSSSELQQNAALALVSLDISTPCNAGQRTLESISITTQTPNITISFKCKSDKILAGEKVYCEITKSEPIRDNKGIELLKHLIAKDKFTKITFIDENGEEKETSSYTENQDVAIAIVKMLESKKHRLNINWCSYLPLNGNDDSTSNTSLDCDYNILVHANFAIDSGRKNINNFDECVNKEIVVEPDFKNVIDDKTARTEWNKVLIRNFILPNLLKFAAENTDAKFFECFYSALTSADNKLGYFCLDKGFTFKSGDKWEYELANSINDSGKTFLNKVALYYSDLNKFADLSYYELAVKICNYIQQVTPMEWAIIFVGESLENSDIAEINRIVQKENFPILMLPLQLKRKISFDLDLYKYKLNEKETVIAFLLSLKGALENKVNEVFEILCTSKIISKEIVSEIFKDSRIKESVRLFKLYYFDVEKIKHLPVGKTYKEICEFSKSNNLFLHTVMSKQAESKIKESLLYKYQSLAPKLELFSIGETVAKEQLFLDVDSDVRYKYKNNDIKILDSEKIGSILFSMQEHLSYIKFENDEIINTLINEAGKLKNDEKQKLSRILKSLVAKEIVNDEEICYSDMDSSKKDKACFFYEIIKTYRTGKLKYKLASMPNIDLLKKALEIKPKKYEDFEQELLGLQEELKSATAEQKKTLALYIDNKEVFRKLYIHETVEGEYVRLENNAYECYLESKDETIRFPSNYALPGNIKLIKRNAEIPLQNIIPQLRVEDVINIILLDENNNLGTQEGIKLSGFIRELLEKSSISNEKLCPNSRKRKWIPNNTYQFFALDEIIAVQEINENLIKLCSGIISADDINSDYLGCKKYFITDKESALKQLLSHPNQTSENDKWPWFNLLSFDSLKSDDVVEKVLPLILKTEDCSIKILKTILKDDKKAIIEHLRNMQQADFIEDNIYISRKYKDFIIELGKSFEKGKQISEELLSFSEEIFSYISKEDVIDLINISKEETLLLPSEAKSWMPIGELVNFENTIPDLKDENTLNRKICKNFPTIKTRLGAENNKKTTGINELIDKLSSCENKKLWGAFCYCITDSLAKPTLFAHEELIEDDTKKSFATFHLPEILRSNITIYKTADNYCESLTGNHIKLKDAIEMDTVFYNPPEFNNGVITIELFDNFSAFSKISIGKAIKDLFDVFNIGLPDDKFFKDLEYPSQAPLKTVRNMIFTNVFATLKVLKLDTRAGRYNQIAEQYKKYMDACGEEDYITMKDCCNAIQHYIESNDGKIQDKIRERVINFIRDAEYQEKCILFELFQNADDAYVQKRNNKSDYFNVTSTDNTISIEHCGRPINRCKIGGQPEYKSDLANMLTIGWSDKTYLQNKQTGKFGYGFKTVYLICDEPHIKSGDYDFVIKAAFYPKQEVEQVEYTEKTIVSLKLNENGQKHRETIIKEFENSAKYLVLFSKKIRKITIENTVIEWLPNITSLSKFNLETGNNILLFRTIPDKIMDEQCRYVSFAFRINGNIVCPIDENMPKMWCLAPLSDFKGLNYAINADFKTNTGRQTLACENPDNKEVIQKISKMLVDAIFEMKETKEFGCYFDSMINIILDSKTKSRDKDYFLADFSECAIKKCLENNILPTGTTKTFKYSNQQILSLSAHPFGSHIQQQYKYIDAMNDFIKDCGVDNIIVTTQIVADLLPKESSILEIKSVIKVLEFILNLNCEDVSKQKEILKKFKDSELFNYVKTNNEKLYDCKITDNQGNIKMITQVFEVSEGYGEMAEFLKSLYTPDRPTIDRHIETISRQNISNVNWGNNICQFDTNAANVTSKKITGIYELWLKDYKNKYWKKRLEKYKRKIFPERFDFDLLKKELDENAEYKDGKIPVQFCALLMLAMLQSTPYWGHEEKTIKDKINKLWNYLDAFCNGKDLQDLYDMFLDKHEFNEEELSEFESLLRIYKIRKNFSDFIDILKTAPIGNKQTTKELLTPPNGSGMTVYSNSKSLKLGISLLIRELLESDFYKDFGEERYELNKFTYMPNAKLRKIVFGTAEIEATSEEIFDKIKKELECEKYLQEFLNCHDYPFRIDWDEENGSE